MSEKSIEILMNVLLVLGVLFAGYIIISIFNVIVRKALKKSKLDEVLHTFIMNSLKVILWIMVVITAMGYAGIPISAFLAALGAAGVAVALALKDSLSNFAGGILIIITKPFNKGDYIEDFQTAGNVQKIDLLYTTLYTFDNKTITVPNGKLANSTIINYSRADNRRVDCIFSISYDDDISKAKSILKKVAESNSKILNDPVPTIGVSSQNNGRTEIDLRVWCKTDDYFDVKYFLEEKVKLSFDEAGLRIPFPQMDVHIRNNEK